MKTPTSSKLLLMASVLKACGLVLSTTSPAQAEVTRLVFCAAEKNEIRIEADRAGQILAITQNGVGLEISESKITNEGQSIATAVSFDPIGAVMVSVNAAELKSISAGMIDVSLEVMGAPGTEVLSPRASCTVFQ